MVHLRKKNIDCNDNLTKTIDHSIVPKNLPSLWSRLSSGKYPHIMSAASGQGGGLAIADKGRGTIKANNSLDIFDTPKVLTQTLHPKM